MTASADDNDGKSRMASLPDVLTTLSHETRVLADGLNELQTVIGELLAAGALRNSPALYELQSLDRLSQGLETVSDCLGGMSKQSSLDWKIDVAEATRHAKLSDIKDRLNNNVPGAGTNAKDPTGDFEDFALIG